MSAKEGRRPEGSGTTAATKAAVAHIVPRPTDGLPTGEASAYGPCGHRTLWTVAVRCPHCGGTHLHRGTGPDVLDGRIRAGCGRRYVIRVRRRYVAREAA